MRRVPKLVIEILDSFSDICKRQGKIFIKDEEGAAILAKELVAVLDLNIIQNENLRKRFIKGLLYWVYIKKHKSISLKKVASYVVDYLYQFDAEHEDLIVQQFVKEFESYVKMRWGFCPNVDISDKKVIQAAHTINKVASEFNMSIEQCIIAQHECWDRIKSPLSFNGLADENKARNRVLIWKQSVKEEAKVIKDDYSVEEVEVLKRKWDEVKRIGIEKVLNAMNGKTGFLIMMMMKWKEDKEKGMNIELLNEKYDVDEIVKRWVESGRPVLVQ